MKSTCLAAALLVSTLCGMGTASATAYNLIATPAAGNAVQASPFTLQFIDTNGDGFLSDLSGPNSDTLIAFSGVNFGVGIDFYDAIGGIPTIQNVADGSAPQWLFQESANPALGIGVSESQWTYVLTAAPSAVPLPGTLPLFAGGLGALGLLRFRRKSISAAKRL